MDGSRFELAANEKRALATEVAALSSPDLSRFTRVLDSFIFVFDGLPFSMGTEQYERQNWKDVKVIGAVASLAGKDRLLAQCGWFNCITWLWMNIGTITEIKVKSDSRYRGGEPCLWMVTPVGEYALLSPHKRFIPLWEQTLANFGPAATAARFRRYPPGGSPPAWWDQNALPLWSSLDPVAPLSKLKRPPPVDVQTLQALSLQDDDEVEGPSKTGGGQRRLRRRDEAQVVPPDVRGKLEMWDMIEDSITKPPMKKASQV